MKYLQTHRVFKQNQGSADVKVKDLIFG